MGFDFENGSCLVVNSKLLYSDVDEDRGALAVKSLDVVVN